MIVTLGVRILQIIFAIIALALPVTLIKGMGPIFFDRTGDKAPTLIDYGAFCGGAGLVIAVVGIAAVFLEPLQGLVIMILDGLASFFLLAGGIAFAATIKVGSCVNSSYLQDNTKTFAPSTFKTYGYDVDFDHQKPVNSGKYIIDSTNDIENRCRMVQAETAFIWFMFAAFLGTAVLSFMSRSRGGGRATMV